MPMIVSETRRRTNPVLPRSTTLVCRERMSDNDYISVVTYGPDEMEELFTADERNALARGFQVSRSRYDRVVITWVDAAQAALARGL